MILGIAVGLLLWGWFVGVVDQPHVPAWKVRNAYRWVSLGLVVVCVVAVMKGLEYRAELRQLIAMSRR